jgi:hypothetical protein
VAEKKLVKQRLLAKIKELEARAEQLRILVKIIDGPGLAEDLAEALKADEGTLELGPDATNFDRIKAYFTSNGNGWSTVGEVAAATGLKTSSARDVMSRSNKGDFEVKQLSDHAPKQFRLEEWEAAPSTSK